jgi:hypothetical protein
MRKILAIAITLFSFSFAFAESGVYEFLGSGPYTFTGNDLGKSKYSVLSVKLATMTLKSDVSFFKVGSTAVSECVGVLTSDSKGNGVDGTCLVTDTDGDKFGLHFQRANNTGQVNPGTETLEGISGKYVGMTGNCTYENKSQTLNGVFYGFNSSKCTVSK